MKQLDLIIPGLLGPFEVDIPDYVRQQLSQPEYRDLNRCLSRTTPLEVTAEDFYSTLYQCVLPGHTLSLCEITARYSRFDLDGASFYRADPVHFKAESDHAVLLGPELLDVTYDEARQLAVSFNQHFAEDKIELLHDEQGHWYLKRSQPFALQFYPLDYALGRDIKHFMPYGDDALWWRRIVNEAQMLFFQHPVNTQREQQGRLTINGLWLWDQTPETISKEVNYEAVMTDHPLASAMAQIAGIKVESLSSDPLSNRLMVLDELYASVCYGDINAWLEALHVFNQRFQSILGALKIQGIQQLNIYPCDGRVFHIKAAQRYQFWKRVHPLDHFFKS